MSMARCSSKFRNKVVESYGDSHILLGQQISISSYMYSAIDDVLKEVSETCVKLLCVACVVATC
jgi:hypothetical protein